MVVRKSSTCLGKGELIQCMVRCRLCRRGGAVLVLAQPHQRWLVVVLWVCGSAALQPEFRLHQAHPPMRAVSVSPEKPTSDVYWLGVDVQD